MPHPFQCLLYRSVSAKNDPKVLIAASASCIYSFNVLDGTLISSCPPLEGEKKSYGKDSLSQDSDNANVVQRDYPESQLPRKRRRRSNSQDDAESSSAEIVVDSESKVEKRATIIKLSITHDGKYVIAITGEDKCIKVFELTRCGMLRPYSER